MFGKSLEVQWLGLRALTARTHFFPFRELRSHKLLGGAKKIKSNPVDPIFKICPGPQGLCTDGLFSLDVLT